MRNTFKLIGCVAAVIALAQASAFAEGFTDDFNRAAGAVGNGWAVSSGGNGGGGAPAANIVSNTLEFSRNGWESNAFCEVARSFDATSFIQSDMYVKDQDNAVSINFQSRSSNGGYVLLRARRLSADNTTQMMVTISADGGWYGWSDYISLGVIDWATYSVATDGTGNVNVSVKSNGSQIWNGNFGGFAQSNFVNASITGSWENWTSGNPVYADNFTTTAVPEPSGLIVLASALPLVLIRRKR